MNLAEGEPPRAKRLWRQQRQESEGGTMSNVGNTKPIRLDKSSDAHVNAAKYDAMYDNLYLRTPGVLYEGTRATRWTG